MLNELYNYFSQMRSYLFILMVWIISPKFLLKKYCDKYIHFIVKFVLVKNSAFYLYVNIFVLDFALNLFSDLTIF